MLTLLLGLTLAGLQSPSLDDQRRTLESALRTNPDDVATLLALGDVYLAWPTVGRFRAWRLYDRAAALADDDPEPRYRQLLVGRYLGGDDGERMMRDAIFRILAITPDYRDIWAVWRTLYHGDGHRRRALALLEASPGLVAGRQRAVLLIDLERYDEALRLLDTLEARWPEDPAFPALAAQAAFESGDTVRGRLAYARAVAGSAADTAGVLWRQIEPIATPAEEGRYAVTPAADRPAFYTGFWAGRDPDLLTPANERLGEHFARWRVARDRYRVLHPQTLFHRSPEWRALMGVFAGSVAGTAARAGFGTEAIRGRTMFDDELSRAGVGVDVRDLPEPDSLSRYQRLGLDGRGLIYLRFGEPERVWIDRNDVEVETWAYRTEQGRVAITFARASAGATFGGAQSMAGGDFVIYPTNPVALRNSAVMLERDESAVAAPARLHVWIATFRAEPDGWQEVLIATDADTMAAVAWDRRGVPQARVTGRSPVVLRLPAGTYAVGADGRRAGALGRLRARLVVPRLGGWLSLSSLLLVPGADTAGGRHALARGMPADLVFDPAAAGALTLYAEVYDLPARDSVVRYEVLYTFEPERGSPITFRFERARTAAPTIVERLVLRPGDVPSGTYRVTLRIVDRVLGLRTSTSRVDVRFR